MIGVRRLLLGIVTAATLALGGCGGGDSGGATVSNDTCPDAPGPGGASPFYPEPGTNGPPVGQQIAQMPHTHVTPPKKVTYEHNPPTSGCHYNLGYGTAPIQAGVYVNHVDAEYWVHNLEHGYVAVLYSCPTACPDTVQKLREWYARQGTDPGLDQATGQKTYAKIIVLPWTMDPPFAAVSWDWYDPMTTLDTTPTGELQRFYDNHVNHSPEGSSSP